MPIDAQSYPHIFERIVDSTTSVAALIALRGVSRRAKALADGILLHHVEVHDVDGAVVLVPAPVSGLAHDTHLPFALDHVRVATLLPHERPIAVRPHAGSFTSLHTIRRQVGFEQELADAIAADPHLAPRTVVDYYVNEPYDCSADDEVAILIPPGTRRYVLHFHLGSSTWAKGYLFPDPDIIVSTPLDLHEIVIVFSSDPHECYQAPQPPHGDIAFVSELVNYFWDSLVLADASMTIVDVGHVVPNYAERDMHAGIDVRGMWFRGFLQTDREDFEPSLHRIACLEDSAVTDAIKRIRFVERDAWLVELGDRAESEGSHAPFPDYSNPCRCRWDPRMYGVIPEPVLTDDFGALDIDFDPDQPPGLNYDLLNGVNTGRERGLDPAMHPHIAEMITSQLDNVSDLVALRSTCRGFRTFATEALMYHVEVHSPYASTPGKLRIVPSRSSDLVHDRPLPDVLSAVRVVTLGDVFGDQEVEGLARRMTEAHTVHFEAAVLMYNPEHDVGPWPCFPALHTAVGHYAVDPYDFQPGDETLILIPAGTKRFVLWFDLAEALWDKGCLYPVPVVNAYAAQRITEFVLVVRGAEGVHADMVEGWGFISLIEDLAALVWAITGDWATCTIVDDLPGARERGCLAAPFAEHGLGVDDDVQHLTLEEWYEQLGDDERYTGCSPPSSPHCSSSPANTCQWCQTAPSLVYEYKPPTLDMTAYPHIVEHIVSQCTFVSQLVALRATCRTLMNIADSILMRHIEIHALGDSRNKFTVLLPRDSLLELDAVLPFIPSAAGFVDFIQGEYIHAENGPRWTSVDAEGIQFTSAHTFRGDAPLSARRAHPNRRQTFVQHYVTCFHDEDAEDTVVNVPAAAARYVLHFELTEGLAYSSTFYSTPRLVIKAPERLEEVVIVFSGDPWEHGGLRELRVFVDPFVEVIAAGTSLTIVAVEHLIPTWEGRDLVAELATTIAPADLLARIRWLSRDAWLDELGDRRDIETLIPDDYRGALFSCPCDSDLGETRRILEWGDDAVVQLPDEGRPASLWTGMTIILSPKPGTVRSDAVRRRVYDAVLRNLARHFRPIKLSGAEFLWDPGSDEAASPAVVAQAFAAGLRALFESGESVVNTPHRPPNILAVIDSIIYVSWEARAAAIEERRRQHAFIKPRALVDVLQPAPEATTAINAAVYPHIMDCIVAHTRYVSTLVALRSICHRLKDIVDELLMRHVELHTADDNSLLLLPSPSSPLIVDCRLPRACAAVRWLSLSSSHMFDSHTDLSSRFTGITTLRANGGKFGWADELDLFRTGPGEPLQATLHTLVYTYTHDPCELDPGAGVELIVPAGTRRYVLHWEVSYHAWVHHGSLWSPHDIVIEAPELLQEVAIVLIGSHCGYHKLPTPTELRTMVVYLSHLFDPFESLPNGTCTIVDAMHAVPAAAEQESIYPTLDKFWIDQPAGWFNATFEEAGCGTAVTGLRHITLEEWYAEIGDSVSIEGDVMWRDEDEECRCKAVPASSAAGPAV